MLIDAAQSTLLIVDVQQKLLPAVAEATETTANLRWLIRIANTLSIPTVFSEQYPQGLGATLPCLLDADNNAPVVIKTLFSCVDASCLNGSPVEQSSQIIVAGIEAHVCVLQTVIHLLAIGKTVYVVADAVSSRNEHDKALALERLRGAGAHIVSREMVLFEWLRDSRSTHFKEISREYLQKPPGLSFADALTTLPTTAHLSGLQLWRDGKLEAVIENKPGQTGSLAIYHALFQRYRSITPKAARAGLAMYGEHVADAQAHPGKHPNIDRLLALELVGGGFGVRLLPL